MAHTWKLAIGLGLLGVSLAVGCTVKEGDDDSTGGAAGEGGTSGSGGSSAKGGTGGTTGGSAGKAGSSGEAGKAGSGTGGATAGTGGSTGGTGGTTSEGGMAGDTGGTSGTGGSGGDTIVATCDPASGDLPSHPYPTCDADPPGDECEICIHDSCCDLSKTCYGMEPYNVCGWGGPTEGPYAGLSEKGCFQKCLSDKVKAADGECLADDADTCAADCATPMCYEGAGQIPLIGNATIDLTACMQDNCAKQCFNADTCGN